MVGSETRRSRGDNKKPDVQNRPGLLRGGQDYNIEGIWVKPCAEILRVHKGNPRREHILCEINWSSDLNFRNQNMLENHPESMTSHGISGQRAQQMEDSGATSSVIDDEISWWSFSCACWKSTEWEGILVADERCSSRARPRPMGDERELSLAAGPAGPACKIERPNTGWEPSG